MSDQAIIIGAQSSIRGGMHAELNKKPAESLLSRIGKALAVADKKRGSSTDGKKEAV